MDKAYLTSRVDMSNSLGDGAYGFRFRFQDPASFMDKRGRPFSDVTELIVSRTFGVVEVMVSEDAYHTYRVKDDPLVSFYQRILACELCNIHEELRKIGIELDRIPADI